MTIIGELKKIVKEEYFPLEQTGCSIWQKTLNRASNFPITRPIRIFYSFLMDFLVGRASKMRKVFSVCRKNRLETRFFGLSLPYSSFFDILLIFHKENGQINRKKLSALSRDRIRPFKPKYCFSSFAENAVFCYTFKLSAQRNAISEK